MLILTSAIWITSSFIYSAILELGTNNKLRHKQKQLAKGLS